MCLWPLGLASSGPTFPTPSLTKTGATKLEKPSRVSLTSARSISARLDLRSRASTLAFSSSTGTNSPNRFDDGIERMGVRFHDVREPVAPRRPGGYRAHAGPHPSLHFGHEPFRQVPPPRLDGAGPPQT